jgi:DNA-binding winged helix-turn-helix (wHTH) protein
VAENKETYIFGEFRLNPAAASLRQGAQEVEIAPRAFQVLSYLVENRDRVVSKQELHEAVWQDTFVTDDALVQAITSLRRALGDSVDQPRYIRTKARVGYQFIAPVEDGTAAGLEEKAPFPVWVAPVGRVTARRLMVAIQVAYLIIYAVTLARLERATQSLGAILERMMGLSEAALPILLMLTLIGLAVRLYVITTVVMDHPETGRQFKRLFPAIFVLDGIWAASPLLLLEGYGLPAALVFIPILAYAPFSQITMIRSAYGNKEGGTETA